MRVKELWGFEKVGLLRLTSTVEIKINLIQSIITQREENLLHKAVKLPFFLAIHTWKRCYFVAYLC